MMEYNVKFELIGTQYLMCVTEQIMLWNTLMYTYAIEKMDRSSVGGKCSSCSFDEEEYN